MKSRAADHIFRRRPLTALLLGLLALAALISASISPSPTAAQSPPSAPILAVAVVGDGTLSVSWISGGGATKHEVAYSANGGSWTTYSSSVSGSIVTISGTNNAKTYVARVRAGNDGGWSGWTHSNSAGPWTTAPPPAAAVPQLDEQSQENLRSAQEAAKITQPGLPHGQSVFGPAPAVSAPAAPAALTVEPGEGYLDIAWDAVSGATGYDIRAKTSGSSTWHSVATNVSDTSHRYTTSETIDYVAVRARNAGGTSAWTEKSRLPADDFMNVATGVAPAGGASIQSGASIQAKLAAPTGFTINRLATRVTEIDLNWSSVSGATAYNIICSVGQTGWNWHACGWVDSGAVTYTSVPSDQTRPVTATHYERKAGESRHVPGKYALGYQRAYQVSVRAVNANPDDASDWTNSGVIFPIFGYLKDFSYTRSAGQITMSWTPSYFTTGYEIDCAAYDPTQTPYVPAYTRCATLTDQDDTDDEHSVTISSWTVDGTDYSIDNTKTYDIRICSTNATGRACTLAPWIDPPSLTASNVAATTATLTMAQWSGNWYYKATSGPHTTCQGRVAAGTNTKDLTGLTAGTSYTYSAYSDSTCSTLLATASAFTTTAQLTASSITASGATLTISGHTGQWWYQGGELGEALGSCTSVPSGSTATLTGLDSNTLHEYKVYDQANCATADLLTSVRFTTLHSGGGPGFTASNITHNSARLTLSNHTGNWWYQGGSRSGGEGPCTAGPSTFIVDLSNLTASTAYTYSAYSDFRCTTQITSATTVTFDTLGAP